MPVDGRETPDSAAGGQSPQMLKSFRRSLNGDTSNSSPARRRRDDFARPRLCGRVAVAEQEQVDFRRGVTVLSELQQGRGRRSGGRSMNSRPDSMVVDQTSRNACCGSRFLMTTCTGAEGSGNRTDSWNVRDTRRASPVVSHSPYTDAKPASRSRDWLPDRSPRRSTCRGWSNRVAGEGCRPRPRARRPRGRRKTARRRRFPCEVVEPPRARGRLPGHHGRKPEHGDHSHQPGSHGPSSLHVSLSNSRPSARQLAVLDPVGLVGRRPETPAPVGLIVL